MTDETNLVPHTSNLETQPTTEEILAETERRIAERGGTPAETPSPMSERQRRFLYRANRVIFWLSRRWLVIFNLLAALYIGGAFLAPVSLYLGNEKLGNVLHAFYAPFCHQYPFRSWFLFGPQAAYRTDGALTLTEMETLTHFVGNADVGFKLALCQRCTAIYGMILVAGLVYSIARNYKRIPPIPMWAYVVFGILPMGFDGGFQWLTYFGHWILPGFVAVPHETSPLLRTITGALFGLATVAILYPYVDDFFRETRDLLTQRYGWS
ncbi:MAG: DUF2085 domain-containing protein [Anaerolineae bacterium]|nr:DUF2085 domain-containing protein [Anaerolineae bacterium]